MELKDLEIYRLAREISKEVWHIYQTFTYEDKRIFGDQLMRAVDSMGANIAEGFGRFHFLDKNKFSYQSRGSLFESLHWLEIARERGRISMDTLSSLEEKLRSLHKKLNAYIQSTKKQHDI